MRASDFRRDYKTNLSALEFFVVLDRLDYFFPVNVVRQSRRQFQSPKQRDNLIAFARGKSGALHRNGTGADNSQTHAIAVRNFIITRALDSVPDGVSEI